MPVVVAVAVASFPSNHRSVERKTRFRSSFESAIVFCVVCRFSGLGTASFIISKALEMSTFSPFLPLRLEEELAVKNGGETSGKQKIDSFFPFFPFTSF